LLTELSSSNQFALPFAEVNKHLLEKRDTSNHRLMCQSSNTDLMMPLRALSLMMFLMIFFLPCYALALLQPSRITGAFVGAQLPSGRAGENGPF